MDKVQANLLVGELLFRVIKSARDDEQQTVARLMLHALDIMTSVHDPELGPMVDFHDAMCLAGYDRDYAAICTMLLDNGQPLNPPAWSGDIWSDPCD